MVSSISGFRSSLDLDSCQRLSGARALLKDNVGVRARRARSCLSGSSASSWFRSSFATTRAAQRQNLQVPEYSRTGRSSKGAVATLELKFSRILRTPRNQIVPRYLLTHGRCAGPRSS